MYIDNKKKTYRISISAEDYGECIRELTDAEYELVKGIFTEAEPTNYCSCRIEEVELTHIVRVYYQVNSKFCKQNALVEILKNRYINKNDKESEYKDIPYYWYHKFFKNIGDANTYALEVSEKMHCPLHQY